MKIRSNNFIKGRLISFKFAWRGVVLLLKTEHSIVLQLIIALGITIIGFILKLSQTQWLFQTFAIALIFVAEALNSAIEKIADFVHPDFHKKIAEIKDVSAGGVFFAAFFAIIIGLIIYFPKVLSLFI